MNTVNDHMTHLSDLILTGASGIRDVNRILRSILNVQCQFSVKWDGSPSIICGEDPRDGQFFVATKGVFCKSPRVYKTRQEIDADFKGDLALKLRTALREFSKLGIKGVIQGDIMYTFEDFRFVKILDREKLAFHLNTIVYATEKFEEFVDAEIGVVWHTKYVGDSFETMQAQYGMDIVSDLIPSPEVWMINATCPYPKMTPREVEGLISLSNRIAVFSKRVSENWKPLIDPVETRTYINSKIRNGESVNSINVSDYHDWTSDRFDKKIDSLKTEKARSEWKTKKALALESINRDMELIFNIYVMVENAKDLIVVYLNRNQNIETYVKTHKGYQETNHEGYVLILGDLHVKLVNRSEFSRHNFSDAIIKGWR
jgi:hypothetical protein